MVYKPTYNWGPHPIKSDRIPHELAENRPTRLRSVPLTTPGAGYEGHGTTEPGAHLSVTAQTSWMEKSSLILGGFAGILREFHLVGDFNHLEKYESQWEGLSYILWKIKFMFQTTNQVFIDVYYCVCVSKNAGIPNIRPVKKSESMMIKHQI